MKNLMWMMLALMIFGACTKSNNTPSDTTGGTIVTIDSSEFNGKLLVTSYDYYTGNKISNAQVYLYTRYEDISKNLYLYYRPSNSNGESDFGYLLQGNYYIVAADGSRRDTSLVQILSKRTVNRAIYLQ